MNFYVCCVCSIAAHRAYWMAGTVIAALVLAEVLL
jgi:hypothetical protein